MGDHLFSPKMLDRAFEEGQKLKPEESLLLIDRNIEEVFDFEDATKVLVKDKYIIDIGKDILNPDAIDTGIFVISENLLAEISELERQGDVNLSEGIKALCKKGLLKACDVTGLKWIDIDTPASFGYARAMVSFLNEDFEYPIPFQREEILLNPGPVLTSPKVKQAMLKDICHRDLKFQELYHSIERKLKLIFKANDEYSIILIGSSGTAAIEAVVSSCIPKDKTFLVVSNGAFGERIAEIAASHQIPLDHIKYSWGKPFILKEIKDRILTHPKPFALAMVHHETSVGILNPLKEIGSLLRGENILFIVDCVSSLGGEEVDVIQDNIDICISSANKCIHGISGVSFICINNKIWNIIEPVKPRVFSLDLKRHYMYKIRYGQTPFTPPVQACFALDSALNELLEQDLKARKSQYKRLNKKLRRSLREIGLELFIEDNHSSNSLTCVLLPPYIRFEELYSELKERGYIIYGRNDALYGKIFQIANMGDLKEGDLERFIQTLKEVLTFYRQKELGDQNPH
jgi:2-aminoethylphosphonate-pyruvate transaminase